MFLPKTDAKRLKRGRTEDHQESGVKCVTAIEAREHSGADKLFQPAPCNVESLGDDVLPGIYDELRSVAARCLGRERRNHTLQPTALVHEVYLRLTGSGPLECENHSHLVNVVVRLMRQVLVEYARRRNALRRGSGVSPLPLLETAIAAGASAETVLLDEALQALEAEDARRSRIIELRYFGGFTAIDIARLMGLSTRTVERETKHGYAWLYRWLTGEERSK
jgi:RNA polymerase sigma factor (TIGR02999 family)